LIAAASIDDTAVVDLPNHLVTSTCFAPAHRDVRIAIIALGATAQDPKGLGISRMMRWQAMSRADAHLFCMLL
jgi:hypothetical protein